MSGLNRVIQYTVKMLIELIRDEMGLNKKQRMVSCGARRNTKSDRGYKPRELRVSLRKEEMKIRSALTRRKARKEILKKDWSRA